MRGAFVLIVALCAVGALADEPKKKNKNEKKPKKQQKQKDCPACPADLSDELAAATKRAEAAEGALEAKTCPEDLSEALAAAVEPFVRSGLATLVPWPGIRRQNAAYEHATAAARKSGIRFVALWDVDELAVLPAGDRCLTRLLCRCAEQAHCAGLQLNWRIPHGDGERRITARAGATFPEIVDFAPGVLRSNVKTIVRVAARGDGMTSDGRHAALAAPAARCLHRRTTKSWYKIYKVLRACRRSRQRRSPCWW